MVGLRGRGAGGKEICLPLFASVCVEIDNIFNLHVYNVCSINAEWITWVLSKWHSGRSCDAVTICTPCEFRLALIGVAFCSLCVCACV